MNVDTQQKVKELLVGVMDRIIDKRTVLEPFDEQAILRNNPFGARLVPTQIWLGAKFERSFVTSLGQGIFEQLAKIIAEGSGAVEVENQYRKQFQINTFRNTSINDLLSDQRRSKVKPNWASEVKEITSLNNNDQTEVSSLSDLYIVRANGQQEFYSFKTVKPNLDQTEIAKRDMLRLKAADPVYETYFALPFNPAGEGNVYRSSGHSLPYKLFDMDNDECVLIGSDLWTKIGDDANTYAELLLIFDDVGQYSAERIRREYLKM